VLGPTGALVYDSGGISMTGRIALAGRALPRTSWLVLAAVASLALGTLLWLGAHAVRSLAPASGAAPASGLARLSPAARASLSETLGADNPAYRFRAVSGGGFRASNGAQHVVVAAGPEYATFERGGLVLALRLSAIGYGSSLRAVEPAAPPRASRNRIAYARTGAEEWFVNGPLGIEQGFTVERPAAAAGAAAAPLTLALSLSGNARASLLGGDENVRFAATGGGALRYGGLRVSDASGRALASWMALEGGRLLLRVQARGARFPLRVDPEIERSREKLESEQVSEGEGEGLVTRGHEEGERAGFSVAVSADGDTALVGAPSGAAGGSVWVFARTGAELAQDGGPLVEPQGAASGTCMEEQSEEPGECGFGRSIAISADGKLAVVGAPLADEHAGSAWVFTRSGSTWRASAQLTSPAPRRGGYFGRGVAMSADGSTILVGAPGEDHELGDAWVFERSGESWQASAEPLAASGQDGEGGRFGRTVALSGNGEVALLGSPRAAAALVFEGGGPGGGWTLAARRGGEADSRFGYSLALSEDGGIALIGAPEEVRGAAGEAEGQGSAAVFTRASGWQQQERLAPAPGSGVREGAKERFATSVALSPEGTTAIVGDPGAQAGHGLAWLYEQRSGHWGEPAKQLEGLSYKFTASQPNERPVDDEIGNARAGWSVAVAADGDTMLVGGIGDDHKRGAAFVFTPAPLVTGVEPAKGPQEGGTKVAIEGQHFGGATRVRFVPVKSGGAECPTQGAEAKIEAVEPTKIDVESPAGKGAVDVVVETPFGCSTLLPLDEFTYTPPGHGTGKREEAEGGEEPSPQPEPKREREPSSSGDGSSASSGIETEASQQVLAFGVRSGGACGVSLRGKTVSVQAGGRAVLQLRGTGAGRCAGRVTLSVRLARTSARAHAKTRSLSIGSAGFAIVAGKTLAVKVRLSARGRALLRAGHGKLNASVKLVESAPAPAQARTASVRLVRQRPKKRAAQIVAPPLH
jgi:IPT/TIG domain/FG-GAP repeat